MTPRDVPPLEDLLADALAAFDEGGDAAIQRFLAANEPNRAALERGLQRCREMGLLGKGEPVRDFPDRLGEFHLLRQLGSGGMGVVYEAEQESLGRRVALKVVRPELLFFEGARERFRREIEAVARLAHPAIVPVLASGEQDGLPWYAMELMRGRTVHEVCQFLHDRDPADLRGDDLRRTLGGSPETGTDPMDGTWWQVCTRIVHTIALGVRHAHLRGIVHRDIKPSNVMLLPDGRAVLLDFGVAMVAGSHEFTRTGNTPGSPAFMSPEQLRGDAVDERTDVYSLAATLWQMLALRAPFPGAADLHRIRDGDVPSVRKVNRDVPPELELVVRTAMDRDRDRRYADMDAFAADLQAVLQRRPIAARRLSWSLRTWRWCQRHRVAATALAATAVAAAFLPVVFMWREREVGRQLEANFTSTLEAIQRMLVHVGNDRLRYVPAAADAARESLADAVAMYRKLLARHPDDTRLVGNAADALDRYALMLGRAGDTAGGNAVLREQIALLGDERTDVPAGRLLKRSLARIHLGDFAVQMGARETAVRHFDDAEADLAAAAHNPGLRIDVARHRVELAIQRIGLADQVRDNAGMLAIVDPAIELARGLVAEKDNPSDTRQLVSLLLTKGTVATREKRLPAAIAILDDALALARSIPADAPLWPPASQVTAGVLQRLGNAYVQARDTRAAPTLKDCLALREAIVRDHPQDVALRNELGAALHSLAEMNVLQGQDELAVERLDRAIEQQREVLARMPSFGQARDYLRNHLTVRGTALARLGRANDLHGGILQLAAMNDPSAQRTAARHWLRLAKLRGAATDGDLPTAAACADGALECLLAAERLGWGPNNPLGEEIYAPLRGRPEFDALRQRLDAKTAAAPGGADPADK
ncbi:MAG: serine/threonine protein kinase [Planctomycetes bacterium]|nr:serine/threonine protein kinase [Planctomycetota bacterium]